MDKVKSQKSDKSEPETTAVVSRSGRVIKRSSKLLGFESSDLQEKDKTPVKQSKLVTRRQSSDQEPHIQDENAESSGSSVSVGEQNQLVYAVTNLNMKDPVVVSFVLWAKEVRKTLRNAYPNHSPDQINQQLKDMWKSVPNEDKSRWVQRAKRLLDPDGIDDSTSNGIKDTAKKPSTEVENNLTDTNDAIKCQTKSEKLCSTEPINVAAHLGLLGESLSKIGKRLKEHEGQIAVNGSVSVLLDSLLCTLAPLMCLTQLVPELNVNSQETLSKMIDDVALIMPGL